ncbi:hypothetical protein Sango_0942800 [Sesamum angolense]|uniref:Uncharacterized protein n=1 Tax=Sesamum angolense TaxID=2727404 RepID=A0AAE2BY46_9LAMI|nr:hypothetical protein Sango_0942800 [Sesamum angolense]
MSLICGAYFVGSAWLGKDSYRLSPGLVLNTTEQYSASVKCEVSSVSPALDVEVNDVRENTQVEKCNDKCRPVGSESLPRGIVSTTSNLEMQRLSGPISEDNNPKHRTSLLAVAVGVKQKKLANEIVKKFLGDDFVVMLFHYDGVVDEWHDFEWSDRVIHVSATNQTKWWFAKRFLHPDIVAEYEYLSIIKEEGLEISQPALDAGKSEVHHQITVRSRRSRVHRRYYKLRGGSSGSWVEMMAPVFSESMALCLGDRTVKVGVVDEEYILHLGLPTLGSHPDKNQTTAKLSSQSSSPRNLSDSGPSASSELHNPNSRYNIRLRSYTEMRVFRNRWNKAVKEDECWVNPFEQPAAPQNTH